MLRRISLVAAALAGVPLAVAWIISQNILHPKPRTEDHSLDDFDLQAETIFFPSRDGTRLAGWFIAAYHSSKPSPTVILSHGWARSKEELLPHADFLHRAGYAVLLFDYRHRGDSDGDACTLGLREQADLLGALDAVGERPDVDRSRIAVLGLSTGSVVAILVGARDDRVRTIIAESPFGSFEVIMTRSLRHYYHLPRFPFAVVAKWVIERRLGLTLEDGEANGVIDRFSPRSIFIIADELDAILGADETRRVFDAAREPKQLWLIPGADHARGWQAVPEEYEHRVLEFLNRELDLKSQTARAAGTAP